MPKTRQPTAAELRRRQRRRNQQKREFNKTHYSRIQADLPKELVTAFREKLHGEPLAQFLRQAIEDYIDPPKPIFFQLLCHKVEAYLPADYSYAKKCEYIIECLKSNYSSTV